MNGELQWEDNTDDCQRIETYKRGKEEKGTGLINKEQQLFLLTLDKYSKQNSVVENDDYMESIILGTNIDHLKDTNHELEDECAVKLIRKKICT